MLVSDITHDFLLDVGVCGNGGRWARLVANERTGGRSYVVTRRKHFQPKIGSFMNTAIIKTGWCGFFPGPQQQLKLWKRTNRPDMWFGDDSKTQLLINHCIQEAISWSFLSHNANASSACMLAQVESRWRCCTFILFWVLHRCPGESVWEWYRMSILFSPVSTC